MWWLLVLASLVYVGNDAVYVEYQDAEEISNDDADFVDQYESEDIITITLEEIQDVKGAIKELLAGHQLDHLTTDNAETTTNDATLANDIVTKDPTFTGLTKKIDLVDPTKFYEDIIEEIIDSAKRQGLLTTTPIRKTDTNNKFENPNTTEEEQSNTTGDEQTKEFIKTEVPVSITRSNLPGNPERTSKNSFTPERTQGLPQRTKSLPHRTQSLLQRTTGFPSTIRRYPEIFHDFEGMPQEIPDWIKNFPQLSTVHPERTRELPKTSKPTLEMETLNAAKNISVILNENVMRNQDGSVKEPYAKGSKSGIRDGEETSSDSEKEEGKGEKGEDEKLEDEKVKEKDEVKEEKLEDEKVEGQEEAKDEKEEENKEPEKEETKEKQENKEEEKDDMKEKEEDKEKVGEVGKDEIKEEKTEGENEKKEEEGNEKETEGEKEGSEGGEKGVKKEDKKKGDKEKKKDESKEEEEKESKKEEEEESEEEEEEEEGHVKFKPMTMPTTTTTTTTTKSRKIADPNYYPYPYTSQQFPNTTKTLFTTSLWRTRRRKTTTTPVTTTLGPQFDVPGLLQIIANLTYDFESNITDLFNKTLQKYNIPTCPSIETTEQPIYYDLTNATVVSKCFVCGMHEPQIPFDSFCSDAFAGDFLPVVPIDPQARSHITRFRKYCRYLDVDNFYENASEPRSVYGRFTGGCSVRWTDLSGVYTQRACRNRRHAMTGLHFASKRMAKLELALHELDNGCIISPMASLIPLSRGVSLYARFHACVCTGSWCNTTSENQTWIAYVAILTLWATVTSLNS
ncbi:hypothetical protein evm_005604 [Chilo suppressalis]|nr:hypothetical protein evm_005604 [Chilo suppressalis]